MSINSSGPDVSIDNLLILPADEISYDALPTPVLLKLATQTADPFIATSALGELAQRAPQDARDAAERILDAATWDRHLTAFALTLLYGRDPEGTMTRMATLALTCEDPVILEAMIENILSDSDRSETAEGEALAHTIARCVAATGPAAFADVEQRDRFLKLFGDKRR